MLQQLLSQFQPFCDTIDQIEPIIYVIGVVLAFGLFMACFNGLHKELNEKAMRENKDKDLPIGERFTFEGVELEVVEETNCCEGCYDYDLKTRWSYDCGKLPMCLSHYRADGKDVVFKKVEP